MMRQSNIGVQKVCRNVSYMDEIDDDNVLEALRNLHQRRVQRNAAMNNNNNNNNKNNNEAIVEANNKNGVPPVALSRAATKKKNKKKSLVPKMRSKKKTVASASKPVVSVGKNVDHTYVEEKKEAEDHVPEHQATTQDNNDFEDADVDDTQTTISALTDAGAVGDSASASLGSIINVLSGCSTSSCDRALLSQAELRKWGVCECGDGSGDYQMTANERMLMLTKSGERHLAPVAGMDTDDDDDEESTSNETEDTTFDDLDLTEEQAVKLQEFNSEKVVPTLETIQKINAFLFQGEYEVLQLHSIARMLNQVENKLEQKLETIRGYKDTKRRPSRKKKDRDKNKADIQHLALKVEKVYRLILEVSEEYVAQRILIEGSKIDDVVAGADDGETFDDTFDDTLDDTFDDSLTIESFIDKNEETGEVTMLPAVASFIDIPKNFASAASGGGEKGAPPSPHEEHQGTILKAKSSDKNDSLAEILCSKPSKDCTDDQSALTWWTYTMDAINKDIDEHVQHLKNVRRSTLTPSAAHQRVVDESTSAMPPPASGSDCPSLPRIRKILPVDDVENDSVEMRFGPIDSIRPYDEIKPDTKRPPMQEKVEKKKGNDRKFMKRISAVFGRSKSQSSILSSPSRSSSGSVTSGLPPKPGDVSPTAVTPKRSTRRSLRKSPSSGRWSSRQRSSASSSDLSVSTGFFSSKTPKVKNIVLTREEWRQHLNQTIDQHTSDSVSGTSRGGGRSSSANNEGGTSSSPQTGGGIEWAAAVEV